MRKKKQNSKRFETMQKSGYLEIKQPSNIKGRKMKVWKRKWVVLHKMSNISEGTFAAKLDLYHDELAARNNSQDRVTYVLDKVSAIQSSNSKTRKMAFDIVEGFPVLSLSAATDVDTADWIKTFQHLFWPPPQPDGKDLFQVIIEDNTFSKQFGLYGEYWMLLSPDVIRVKAMSRDHVMSWKLKHLKRFNLDKDDLKVLIIECGAASNYGEANFRFRSNDVRRIFQSIRKNIQVAVEKRKRTISTESEEIRERSSSGASENGYKLLLASSKDELNLIESQENQLNNNGDGSLSSSQLTENIVTLDCDGDGLQQQRTKPAIIPRKSLVEKNLGVMPQQHCCKSLPGSPFASRRATVIRAMSSSYDELSSVHHEYSSASEIVSKEIIHNDELGEDIEVTNDSRGYSHVTTPRKMVRSVSGYENCDETRDEKFDEFPFIDTSFNKEHSCDSPVAVGPIDNRTESLTSNDSGFGTPYTDIRRNKSDTSLGQLSQGSRQGTHKPTSSFDSAISNSSNSETILASVQNVIVMSEMELNKQRHRHSLPANTQAASLEDYDNPIHSKTEIYCELGANHKQKKEKKEGHYEEVSKRRKDLSKFLGIDPTVNPADVPPALPERPATLPARRKDVHKAKGKGKSGKRVSFHPFKKEKEKEKEKEKRSSRAESFSSFSSSSNSDGEDDPANVSRIKSWPIQNTDKLMDNSIYEPTEVVNSSVVISPIKQWPIQKRKGHLSNNMLYEPANTHDHAIGKSKSQNDLLDMPFRPRNSSDSALLDRVYGISGRRSSDPHSRPKSTPHEDLLTGDHTSSSSSCLIDTEILTPDTSVLNPPPLVEQLIPLDIPPQKTTHIVLESPLKEDNSGEKVVFRAKADGNFVWDPFPRISRAFDGPISSWGQPNERRSSEEDKNVEPMISPLATAGSSPKSETFIDSMDPFDLFHLGHYGLGSSQKTAATPIKSIKPEVNNSVMESSYINCNSGSKEDLLVDLTEEESIYMDMRCCRAKSKTEDEYVCPSDCR